MFPRSNPISPSTLSTRVAANRRKGIKKRRFKKKETRKNRKKKEGKKKKSKSDDNWGEGAKFHGNFIVKMDTGGKMGGGGEQGEFA